MAGEKGYNGFSFGYKAYRALLSQTGVNNPVVTSLLQNEIGNIIWARTGVGIYTATLAGAFITNKTFLPSPGAFDLLSTTPFAVSNFILIITSTSVITLNSYGDNILSDSRLNYTPVEIRIYN